MRLGVASLRRMITGKLPVEFVHQDLTSYSGLELLRRCLRQHDLPRRLRAAREKEDVQGPRGNQPVQAPRREVGALRLLLK